MKNKVYHAVLQILFVLLLSSVAHSEYCLQFLSSKSKKGAEDAVKGLSAKGLRVRILVQEGTDSSGGPWYKVRTAPVTSVEEAMRQKKEFEAAGLGYKILIVESKAESSDHSKKKQRTDVLKTPSLEMAGQSQKPQSPPPPVFASGKARVLYSKEADSAKRDITLAWDPSEDPAVSGYKIYYDTDPDSVWDPQPADCAVEGRPPIAVKKGVNELTLHGLNSSKNYYFSVTAHKKDSNVETAYANGIIAPALAIEQETRDRMSRSTDSGGFKERETGEESGGGILISPGDVLEMVVPGQREMSRTYDVDPDGNIYMVVLGRIKASGVNASELSSRLNEKLKNYVNKGDTISVQLASRERYIQIQQGVRYPGWYRVPQKSQLNNLIEMAGGLLAGADYSRIVLKRKTNAGDQELVIRGEVSLAPNDLIVIPFPKGFDEKIDAGDLLFVNIPEKEPPVRSQNIASVRIAEESKQNRIEVDRRGFLHVPQYGEFYINNLTPSEVTQLVRERLPKYLAHESGVEVNIVEKRHTVQVLGHVKNPGWHNVAEDRNLQEVLFAAGGAIDGAVMSEISIQREWGGLLRSFRVNLQQFNITGDPRLVTPLHANDVIHVPISSFFGDVKRSLDVWTPPPERLTEDLQNKFKIFGAVRTPGSYEPREDMTLLEAMVTAGGETHNADMSRVMIIRNGKIELKFNMEKFLEGRSNMRLPSVMRGDTVYVSYVPLTIFEPKEDQVYYIFGEVKNAGTTGSSGEGFKLRDELTVIQAIALAGGPTEWANVRKITIIRNVAGKQENIPFNLERAIAGKYPELNMYVQPNDVIFVP